MCTISVLPKNFYKKSLSSDDKRAPCLQGKPCTWMNMYLLRFHWLTAVLSVSSPLCIPTLTSTLKACLPLLGLKHVLNWENT